MHRSSAPRITNIYRQLVQQVGPKVQPQSYDVFINHRGIDTKRNVAGLLYNHLSFIGVCPFLDSKSMEPGDILFEKIDVAIRECKVGIAVFSPMYCDSYFCLHELSLMMESKTKIVPIFCDIKPSELCVKDDGSCSANDLNKFKMALEQVKLTVGLTFDTLTGDWPEFLTRATEVVIKNLHKVEEEGRVRKLNKNNSSSPLSRI